MLNLLDKNFSIWHKKQWNFLKVTFPTLLKCKTRKMEQNRNLRNEGLRPNAGLKQHFLIRNVWLGIEIAKAESMEIFHYLLEHTVFLKDHHIKKSKRGTKVWCFTLWFYQNIKRTLIIKIEVKPIKIPGMSTQTG